MNHTSDPLSKSSNYYRSKKDADTTFKFSFSLPAQLLILISAFFFTNLFPRRMIFLIKFDFQKTYTPWTTV